LQCPLIQLRFVILIPPALMSLVRVFLAGLSFTHVSAARADGGVLTQVQDMLEKYRREGAKATPDVRKDIEAMKIRLDNAVSLIINGRLATQGKLDTTFTQAETKTMTAQSRQQSGTTVDNQYYNCMLEEIDVLVTVEDAVTSKNTWDAKQREACILSNNTKRSDHALPDSLALFNCDMTKDANACLQAMDSHEALFEQNLGLLTGQVNGDVDMFTVNFQNCSDSSKAFADAAALLETRTQMYHEKVQTCTAKTAARQQAFCDFSDAYSSMCSSIRDYSTLLHDTKTPRGNEHSEPDRQDEYQTVKVGSCELGNFLLPEAEAHDCSFFDFAAFQGPLNRHDTEEEYALISVYNCDKTSSFTFDGRKVIRPDFTEGELPSSSDYQTLPFSIPVVNHRLKICQ